MTNDEFIEMATENLLQDGFEVIFENSSSVDGCAGWFNHYSKEFLIAVKNKSYFETFVHEYCHYLQWKHSPIFWNKFCDGYGKFMNHLQSKRTFSEKYIESSFMDVLALEHDCESRASRLIKELNLNINHDEYCRFANVYLWHYFFVRLYKKWIVKSLYSKELVSKMPTEIMPLSYYLDIRNLSKRNKVLLSRKFQ